jgi:hypothetical protein
LPDVAIGKLSEEIIPLMKPNALVLTLDPAAPLDGVIYHRDDLGYVIAHPCHPSCLTGSQRKKRSAIFMVVFLQNSLLSLRSCMVRKHITIR